MPDPNESSAAIGAILTALGTMPQDVAVIKTDIGYLKTQSIQNAANIGKALDTLSTVSSDASQSPAGRDLLRRIKDIEVATEHYGKRLDGLEDFRTEVVGGMRLLRAEATFATVVAGLVGSLWTLHVLGVMR